MIPVPSGVQVWLATGHTDMRKGFDGLALLVQETLRRNPHNGHLFVFRGRRGSLIKVLWHDGQGMCIYAKRLERGRFVWPSTAPREGADRSLTTTPAQLGYLLEGIDWRLPRRTYHPGGLERMLTRHHAFGICAACSSWREAAPVPLVALRSKLPFS
jgi:transposase